MTAVFLRFLNLSIAAGWMLPVVLLLRLCLKKAPRWITCVLWGLVALRLVLPFSIESPISLIPSAQTVVGTAETDGTAPMVDSGLSAIDKPLNEWLQTPVQSLDSQSHSAQEGNADSTPETPTAPAVPDATVTPTPTVSRAQRILNVATYGWLTGVGLMLLYELISVWRVRRRVLDAVRLCDNIWQSERVASPFIFGLFRPRIYIPYGLEEPMLAQVLAHERAHLHRRDHWIKPFAFTLLAVYWYNPLLWIGYVLLCRDIEVACDQRVVRSLSESSRRQYAAALLQCGVERRSIAACPLAFGEVSIKQRIKSVLSYRKPLLWVIIASLVACAAAAVCLLTVPNNKPKDNEDSLVVLSSQEIKPNQQNCFYGNDIDGSITEGGPDWLWAHAENPNDRKGETDIPLVLTDSKAAFDELIEALEGPMQYGMHNWFALDTYDASFFEDKAVVWLFVPGYNLGSYTCSVALEETNEGLRYAVSLEYKSTSMFDPSPDRCQYLMLFEVERDVVEQAGSLSTRHESVPIDVPAEEGDMTCYSLGNVDLDGDGEKESIRVFLAKNSTDYAFMVVCKADGTPILRESIQHQYYSLCYLVPQEDGSSLLLFVEANNSANYPSEAFGVLSLKDGVRTVVDYSSEGSVYGLFSFQHLIPYVQSLSDWMENAQLLYACEDGDLYHGDELGKAPRYTPLAFLDPYRNSGDDTLQDIFENVLDSYQAETLATMEMDLDGVGEKESLSVMRYIPYGIDRFDVLVRNADASILTSFNLDLSFEADGDRSASFYLVKDETGKESLKMVTLRSDGSYYVGDVTISGVGSPRAMTSAQWSDYTKKTDAELQFYIQGMGVYFPEDVFSYDTYDELLKRE